MGWYYSNRSRWPSEQVGSCLAAHNQLAVAGRSHSLLRANSSVVSARPCDPWLISEKSCFLGEHQMGAVFLGGPVMSQAGTGLAGFVLSTSKASFSS